MSVSALASKFGGNSKGSSSNPSTNAPASDAKAPVWAKYLKPKPADAQEQNAELKASSVTEPAGSKEPVRESAAEKAFKQMQASLIENPSATNQTLPPSPEKPVVVHSVAAAAKGENSQLKQSDITLNVAVSDNSQYGNDAAVSSFADGVASNAANVSPSIRNDRGNLKFLFGPKSPRSQQLAIDALLPPVTAFDPIPSLPTPIVTPAVELKQQVKSPAEVKQVADVVIAADTKTSSEAKPMALSKSPPDASKAKPAEVKSPEHKPQAMPADSPMMIISGENRPFDEINDEEGPKTLQAMMKTASEYSQQESTKKEKPTFAPASRHSKKKPTAVDNKPTSTITQSTSTIRPLSTESNAISKDHAPPPSRLVRPGSSGDKTMPKAVMLETDPVALAVSSSMNRHHDNSSDGEALPTSSSSVVKQSKKSVAAASTVLNSMADHVTEVRPAVTPVKPQKQSLNESLELMLIRRDETEKEVCKLKDAVNKKNARLKGKTADRYHDQDGSEYRPITIPTMPSNRKINISEAHLNQLAGEILTPDVMSLLKEEGEKLSVSTKSYHKTLLNSNDEDDEKHRADMDDVHLFDQSALNSVLSNYGNLSSMSFANRGRFLNQLNELLEDVIRCMEHHPTSWLYDPSMPAEIDGLELDGSFFSVEQLRAHVIENKREKNDMRTALKNKKIKLNAVCQSMNFSAIMEQLDNSHEIHLSSYNASHSTLDDLNRSVQSFIQQKKEHEDRRLQKYRNQIASNPSLLKKKKKKKSNRTASFDSCWISEVLVESEFVNKLLEERKANNGNPMLAPSSSSIIADSLSKDTVRSSIQSTLSPSVSNLGMTKEQRKNIEMRTKQDEERRWSSRLLHEKNEKDKIIEAKRRELNDQVSEMVQKTIDIRRNKLVHLLAENAHKIEAEKNHIQIIVKRFSTLQQRKQTLLAAQDKKIEDRLAKNEQETKDRDVGENLIIRLRKRVRMYWNKQQVNLDHKLRLLMNIIDCTPFDADVFAMFSRKAEELEMVLEVNQLSRKRQQLLEKHAATSKLAENHHIDRKTLDSFAARQNISILNDILTASGSKDRALDLCLRAKDALMEETNSMTRKLASCISTLEHKFDIEYMESGQRLLPVLQDWLQGGIFGGDETEAVDLSAIQQVVADQEKEAARLMDSMAAHTSAKIAKGIQGPLATVTENDFADDDVINEEEEDDASAVEEIQSIVSQSIEVPTRRSSKADSDMKGGGIKAPSGFQSRKSTTSSGKRK